MNHSKNILKLLCTTLVFLSCQTVPVEHMAEPSETLSVSNAAEECLSVILGSVETALSGTSVIKRDIDDREWLMAEVNRRADADQLMISLVYEALYYRNWDDDERRSFIHSLLGTRIQDDPEGKLNAFRQDSFSELEYLIEHSRLLSDSPWMVRDFFDERSEFSYWYLLYLGRSFNGEWQKNKILPVLRDLIREDRITAASYIWLNKPESLGTMEGEIQNAGYPWNRGLHLLRMSRYIRAEVNRLYPEGSPDPRPETVLF